MNWRWFILDYVPPELSLDGQERRAIRRRATKLMQTPRIKDLYRNERRDLLIRKWWMLVLPALPYLVIHIGGMLLFVTHSRPVPTSIWLLAPIWFVASMVALWFHLVIVRRLHTRPFINHALMERGFEYCLGCGYSLSELPKATPRCPECGAERMLPIEPESSP